MEDGVKTTYATWEEMVVAEMAAEEAAEEWDRMDPAACTDIEDGLQYYEATNAIPIPFKVVTLKNREKFVREFVEGLAVRDSFLVCDAEFEFAGGHLRLCRQKHKDRKFIWQRENDGEDIRIWRTA